MQKTCKACKAGIIVISIACIERDGLPLPKRTQLFLNALHQAIPLVTRAKAAVQNIGQDVPPG